MHMTIFASDAHARCGRRGERLNEIADRGSHARDPLVNALVLEHVGILLVDSLHPTLERIDIGRQAFREILELRVQPEHRRENREEQQGEYRNEQNIRQRGADDAIHAMLVEPVHRTAQDEHEHDRPNDHADGVRQKARQVNGYTAQQKSTDPRPYDREPVAGLALLGFEFGITLHRAHRRRTSCWRLQPGL